MAGDDEVERWPTIGAWCYSLVFASPRSNRRVVALAAPREGDRVLDVGCGPGAAVRAAAVAGATATGVDPSAAMVRIATRRARRRASARFVVGHAADLPLEDASVDLAWTIAALHHWPDAAAGLDELRRVLAPGGRLLVAEKRLSRTEGHGMTRDEAEGLAGDLAEHGFDAPTVTEVRVWPSWMLVVEARVGGSA